MEQAKDLVTRSQQYAIKVHTDVNQWYDADPYTVHLEEVVACFSVFKHLLPESKHDIIESACWLHDAIEDARQTPNDIVAVAGKDVAKIVYAVTNELGWDRTERALRTYPKIRESIDYVFVKLCDRLANTSRSLKRNSRMGDTYIKEYTVFKYALDRYPTLKPMWDQLEALMGIS